MKLILTSDEGEVYEQWFIPGDDFLSVREKLQSPISPVDLYTDEDEFTESMGPVSLYEDSE